MKQVGTDRNEVKFWMVLTRKITYKDSIFKIIKKAWADSRFTLRNMSLVALKTMPTNRFAKKHWKMVVILLVICAAMLMLRWAAMIWG